MKILAIDTSCDDTSVAISEDLRILSNVFWSKIKTYEKWGGVVPIEARRQHEEFLGPAIQQALEDAKLDLQDIDTFAVTYGPGLAIALEPGIEKAKELSKQYEKPLIAINHMIGHIYSNLAEDAEGIAYSGVQDFEFPLLALTISGGHTDLYRMERHMEFERIGSTLDDAIGEAYDKVGRLLGLGFPAGAKIDAFAEKGDPKRFLFPRPLSETKDYNWSYSGLKTAVLYQVQKLLGEYAPKPGKGTYKMDDASSALDEQTIYDLCASFQEAAIDSLLIKVTRALDAFSPKMLVVGGGVIANSALRKRLEEITSQRGISLSYPKPMWLCTDNAAMIAAAAHFYAQKDLYVQNISDLERIPSLTIS